MGAALMVDHRERPPGISNNGESTGPTAVGLVGTPSAGSAWTLRLSTSTKDGGRPSTTSRRWVTPVSGGPVSHVGEADSRGVDGGPGDEGRARCAPVRESDRDDSSGDGRSQSDTRHPLATLSATRILDHARDGVATAGG